VRVRADSTLTGSYAALTFRVPTESATASTTRLALTLPPDRPFGHVSVRPVPGWRVEVTQAALPHPVAVNGATITKAARTVTWTADTGSGIAPGQYQEFSISVGPLPSPGTLVLPVTQEYDDGKVVAWDQPEQRGEPEPERPAPQVDVVGAASSGDGGTTRHPVSAATPTDTASSAPDSLARVLAGGALLVALVVGAAQLRWQHRTGVRA
jgi:uncharacterized protein YcnI